jgi:CubicO group peptidase (beta-lactamase class C family)
VNLKRLNRSIGFPALLCLLGVIVAGCVPIPAPAAPPAAPALTSASTPAPPADAYWPTDGWRSSTPEEQGMDSKLLADMVAEIEERKINVHSLLVVRNGYLVSENYFGSYGPDDKQEIQSAVKSFIGTLVGIALDKGYLAGIGERVVDLFPDREIQAMDARKEAMTVEDLLTMRPGLDYLDPDFFASLKTDLDWIGFMLDKPMVEDPGIRWNYCSGCSYLLSAIVQNTSGMDAHAFADRYLLEPLGITDYRISGDNVGDPAGGYGWNITPRDMAKLGYLYLRKGQWDGQQIVSSEWVEKSTQMHADLDVNAHFEYGYHWFTMPEMEGYAALGGGGQIILVIPKHDLVIVTTANTEESLFELFDKYVLPAVQKP